MTSLNLAIITQPSGSLTTSTTAYTAGDILGSEITFTIPNSKTGCMIMAAVLTDKADVIGAVDLYLHDTASSFGSDNAAPSVSDANNLLALPTIQFPVADDLGGARRATIDSIAIPIVPASGSNFFGTLVTRSAHTFFGAATDLQVRLLVSVDT